MSQANLGLIRRDLLDQAGPRAALARLSYGELVAMSKRAAQLFLEATLPLDPFAGIAQTPDDYVRQLSATTGMPHVLVRRNMLKVHGVLAQVDEVLGGLTRGLDLSLLDTGIGMVAGRAISFFPRGDSMGVVLPNNSPGVHSLWAPTTVLKIPLVLKPGSAEPWTPFRMIQAWLAAGCPPEAFSFYPSDHAGGNEILRRTGRGMVFGDVKATERWRKEGGRVEIHGPGFSKVILGADALANWEQHIDTIAASVADNGGRSCVNASGVWVTGKGREIAEALAKKLAAITPRAADDEAAGLAPFVDPSVAERVSALIDKDLEIQPGVEDVSARGPRHQPRRQVGGLDLPAADGAAGRSRASARQPRVHVPVRQRGGSARGRDAGLPRPLAGRHRHHRQPGADRAAGRVAAGRSPEHRLAADDADRLGSAARG